MERPPARAWSEVYAPVSVALLGAAAALVAEPAARAWIDGGAAPMPNGALRAAWMSAGPVLVGVLLARGISLWASSARPSAREAGAWGAAAALLGLFALADRVRLLEAQALMLGFIALVWWCSESAERAAVPFGRRAGSGAGVLVVLAALGAAALVLVLRGLPYAERVTPAVLAVVSGVLVWVAPRSAPWVVVQCAVLAVAVAGIGRVVGGAVLAARASEASGVGHWMFAVAESLSAPAYLSGLSTLAPEAAACMLVAVATWGASRSARRGPGVAVGVVLVLAGAGLLVRWALGMGVGR